MALIGVSFKSQSAVDIELVRGIAISNISIERITQTANAKTEFVPLRRSFRLVKYGQWFVDQIDFTYAQYMGWYEQQHRVAGYVVIH